MSSPGEVSAGSTRTALVLAGGGMSAAFSAGVLQGLDERGLASFDVAAAVSASAPTLAYYAAGQLDALGRIWNDYVPSSEVVRPVGSASGRRSVGGPIRFDTDHLVDVVLRRRVPLDVSALAESAVSCRFFVARMARPHAMALEAFDQHTGDIWLSLKACMAMPGLTRWPVDIDGNRFLDAGILDPVPIALDGSLLADRTLAVLNSPRSHSASVARRVGLRALSALDSSESFSAVAVSRIARSQHRLRVAERRGQVLVIAPDCPIPAFFATTSRSKIERSMAMGRDVVARMEQRIRQHLFARSPAASEPRNGPGRDAPSTDPTPPTRRDSRRSRSPEPSTLGRSTE